MTKRVEPEIPSITLDHDQVKSSRSKPHSSVGNDKTTDKPVSTPIVASSKTNNFFTVVIYLALAGAAWFFYQESLKLKSAIVLSEQRILQLENQLSATGEEMGESTVALKIKLEAMTTKTEQLWTEMDKLWASAWRRNQSEIKELRSKSIKQGKLTSTSEKKLANAVATISEVKEKQTSNAFELTALGDQITAANNIRIDLDKLKSQLSTLNEKSSGRDNQQMEVATTVNELDTMLKLVLERIDSLETKLANQAKSAVAKTPPIQTPQS